MTKQNRHHSFNELGGMTTSKIVKAHQSVSVDSIFCNPIWNMSSLVSLPGTTSYEKRWDFTRIPGYPAGFALTLAEYAYARLYTPNIGQSEEVDWLTVHNELIALSEFANFCSKSSLNGFDELSDIHFTRFLHHLKFSDNIKKKTDERISYIFRIIYILWEYRTATTNCFAKMPFGKSHKKVFNGYSRRRADNSTPFIPEKAYGAITSIALSYVLEYSKTIIPVWIELNERWNDIDSPTSKGDALLRKLRIAAVEVLNKTDAPWRSNNWTTIGDLYAELHQLKIACTIVILAFSGIRLSELLSIEEGCCITETYKEGYCRYYINTLLHKHRKNGTKDTWVVIEEVVTAINILGTLTEKIRIETGDMRLFLTDGTGHFFGVHRQFSRNKISEYKGASINYQINAFQKNCNDSLVTKIPLVETANGVMKPWLFSTRQFRRTLARYIARQPFGIIAGMLQYKHVEVTVFEGYAGNEPDWNKLLDDEKVLAQIDLLEEVAIDLSNGEVAGELGQALKEQFSVEFKGRAEDFPPSQIAKWLATSQKKIFVGKFNFCFFDPTKAECTKEESTTPVLNSCQPDFCSNACISKRHIPKWEAQLQQTEDLARQPKTSKVLRVVLMSEATKLRSVINTYGEK